MSGDGIEIGQGALAKAMELARKCERAAKVAALLVPLATIALSQAHATVTTTTGQNDYSGSAMSGSKAFSVGAENTLQTGSASWKVFFNSCSSGAGCNEWDYTIDLSLTSPGTITKVDIPVDFTTLDNLMVNGGASGVTFNVAEVENQAEFTPVDVLPFSTFDLTFDSLIGPQMADYGIFGNLGGDDSVDPPLPSPEPGSLSLLGMALIGLAGLRRRLTR